jgi:hypothetical protein
MGRGACQALKGMLRMWLLSSPRGECAGWILGVGCLWGEYACPSDLITSCLQELSSALEILSSLER